MSIKTSFSIKDLENLSGIKAHTIRIWEKRYNILVPERSDSNIRTYDLSNLQKILNVSVLNQNGYKISKIAKYSEVELNEKVKQLTVENNSNSLALNDFKLAMFNFDQLLFERTYNKLLVTNSFRDIFLKEFLTLLEDIGTLWATDTIGPAHEHFVSTLVKQKILINIERVQIPNSTSKPVFVLFLPLNEMHDIGLLYLHFELLLKGYKSIFLGAGISMEDLGELQNMFDEIVYVSYFTVEPSVNLVLDYLNEIDEKVLSKRGEEMHVLGRNTEWLSEKDLPQKVMVHKTLLEVIEVF